MGYKVNDTEITLQPTSGRWLPPKVIAKSGHGHEIEEPYFEFELKWELVAPSDYNQLLTWYNSIGQTGTCSVYLPEYGGATYAYHGYSGCVLSRPQLDIYFQEYIQNVTLRVMKIRIS